MRVEMERGRLPALVLAAMLVLGCMDKGLTVESAGDVADTAASKDGSGWPDGTAGEAGETGVPAEVEADEKMPDVPVVPEAVLEVPADETVAVCKIPNSCVLKCPELAG